MTKSTRHKRFRKQELKKIKLKVGKKLKKAQNETKIDFMTRKIILREQLSVNDHQSSLVTKKKLHLKELLSRLSHHSVYVKQDGLNGLKELVLKNNKEELVPHLSALFAALNPCLLDPDHLIRTTAVRVVEAIIMKIGSMIQPYFYPLTAHLSCAMVHMNTGVQSDSLVLMDTLMCHTPSLIAQSANTILQNFFLLISRKIDHQQKYVSVDSYALISNPTNRLASIKWRIKLLRSLNRYLEVILGEKRKIEASVPVSLWQVVTLGCLPSLTKRGGRRASVHSTKILTEEEAARSFISNIVPLLFQTLSEVGYNSENRIEASGTPLEPMAIELLRCISEIILHLWNVTELVTQKDPSECTWLMKTFRKKVADDLLLGFPYCVLESHNRESSGSKEKAKINIEVECQQLNINLAALYLYLEHKCDVKRKILRYFIDLLSNEDIACQLKLDKVVSTACFLMKSKMIFRNLNEKLLEAGLKCYQAFPSSNKSKNILLDLPMQASEFTCRHLWKSSALNMWMVALVESAIENTEEELMELLLQFRLRNTPGFSSIMAQKKDLLREKLKFNVTSTSVPRCELPKRMLFPDK